MVEQRRMVAGALRASWCVASHAVSGVLCLVAAASGLHAQQLRGTVRDSASGRPVAGAVVMLQDSAGAMLARNITNERGEYHIVRTASFRQLRVVRIGFRPQVVRVAASTVDVLTVNVVMVPTPTMLEAVRVTGGARCPARSDRLAAFALLEQARAALLNTIVAREANAARMKRLQFTREVTDNGMEIVRQEVQVDHSAEARASYVSERTGSEFVRLGFRRDSAGKRAYFGPDAEALLDDGFRDGYCFHLSPKDRNRPNQVGLAFAPLNHRDDRVDIEGALWIDTVARALHDIDFTYRGVELGEALIGSGGHISFREMQNGVVLIDRWSLRSLSAMRDTVRARNSVAVRTRLYVRETGGELARAMWPDSSVWEASLGVLNGRVVTRSGKPVGHAMVRLVDTDYLANTADDGTFGMADLLPGPYTAVILDTALTPLGISLHTDFRFVAERGRASVANIVSQTPDEYVEQFCAGLPRAGPTAVDPQSAWLIGRVVNSDGNPVNGARVSLVFDQETGSDGLFGYCRELHEGETVKIRVRAAGHAATVTEVRVKGGVNVVKVEVK